MASNAPETNWQFEGSSWPKPRGTSSTTRIQMEMNAWGVERACPGPHSVGDSPFSSS